jgi:pilus assembly protein CpaE
MKMCTVALGTEERELEDLDRALQQIGISISRQYPYYPDEGEIRRLVRALDPDILFISTAVPSRMEAAVAHALEVSPNIQVVLLDAAAGRDTLRRAMQLGVRECLMIPVDEVELRGVLERTIARRRNAPGRVAGTNCLYTFLPARPGVGGSTLAVQAALHLPGDAEHRNLLVDADLDAGMVQFLLQGHNPHSLIEALERVEQLDEHLWPQLVSERGHLDILQAGDSNEDYRPDLGRLQYILEFARRHYSAIIVDLPPAINRLTTDLMQQSKAIYLVTTTEVAALHMARKRWLALCELQLQNQVRLLVNRSDKHNGVPIDEVANAVGLPVHGTFANDYLEVQKAILAGGPVPTSRPLGNQIAQFAASLSKDPIPTPAPKRRRYLEIFTLHRPREVRWGS